MAGHPDRWLPRGHPAAKRDGRVWSVLLPRARSTARSRLGDFGHVVQGTREPQPTRGDLATCVARHTAFETDLVHRLSLTRKVNAMLARPPQTHRTPACNDNGTFPFRGRSPTPPNILDVAVEIAGSISLRYVAEGVLIIASARQAARNAA